MRFTVQHIVAVVAVAPAALALPQSSSPGDVFKRQINPVPGGICCDGNCETELVGDGNPHVDWLHKQVSAQNDCNNAPTCSSGTMTSHTVGWQVDVGGNIPWASLGFSVMESVTTGSTEACHGRTGETVCQWVKIPHDAYTVQKKLDGYRDICDDQPDGPYVIKSPQEIKGEQYYCVFGDACRNDGDQYWCLGQEEC